MSHTVLITGSSSGFGLLTTKALVRRGHTVFATMRDPEGRNAERALELHDFAKQQPGAVHILALDVTDDAKVDAAVARAIELEGRIDVLVNNAGYGVAGFAEGFTVDQVRNLFEVNVFGVQRLNRAVLPHMRERGQGLLVHISSGLGRIVVPFCGPYTASKFALEALAESYRYELARTGVDVVIVEPGAFATSFASGLAAPKDEARIDTYGDELKALPAAMWSGVMAKLQADDAPDPARVADCIAELVEMPAGERPLRTVVDAFSGDGPKAVNEACRQVQRRMFEGMGMPDLLGVKGER
ncbi:MAG: SDR family oxidoreductase [Myxococcales bacterium]|nr:SDR family oxidoreductase [Myxococcales bacterium]MCB9537307.1 SDR family oxidoreductase [Myxococcales bacterium]